jgi:hypothetical protein
MGSGMHRSYGVATQKFLGMIRDVADLAVNLEFLLWSACRT